MLDSKVGRVIGRYILYLSCGSIGDSIRKLGALFKSEVSNQIIKSIWAELLAPFLAVNKPVMLLVCAKRESCVGLYICSESATLNFLARRNRSYSKVSNRPEYEILQTHKSQSIQSLRVASCLELRSQLEELGILFGGCVAWVAVFLFWGCCWKLVIIVLGIQFDIGVFSVHDDRVGEFSKESCCSVVSWYFVQSTGSRVSILTVEGQ